MSDNALWYVVHTYSGYENSVAQAVMKAAENRRMQDLILEVNIPMETVVEHTDQGDKTVERKVFPGYVLVKMVMTNEAWYVVRNTRGVTGFVGPDSRAIPLSGSEIEFMLNRTAMSIDIAVGEDVRVLSGPLEGHVGKVTDIDTIRQKINVVVSMFGRDVPVEVDYDQVEHV